MNKFLIVFDFDETIIQHNSDCVILKCNPDQSLPEELLRPQDEECWSEYMGKVFQYLGETGVKEETMRKVLAETPLTKEMLTLFQFLRKSPDLFECVIISDANTFFINSILQANDLSTAFQKIYTNPSCFDNKNTFTISPYHSHVCEQCPINMCKRQILHDHLVRRAEEEVEFDKIFYVGDGTNDFCPSVDLTTTDVIFPRKNYPLDRLISEFKMTEPSAIQAQVVPWESGEDILLFLEDCAGR
ncbi:phosphoethanolamine/phosphocholine phosphatase [Amblyraja radiata]|uniref:phosphoethanolamine/phosphocholine phosphatase n=1 Tax=Amblyraja radiata TaxID=386614 RepID=UPI001402D566|nr:phosphoethanolamine/phosphocholine phosphatase [Amblyraja radiata]XP_032891270.1 phosphoethanolamine/phosphocholine phosphatase [Amblyraja radiata]XP_032891272.1 phosphoethanolamine/phosphocholine phosphatase [Amblyraja radiata]XP_032891273.1 phosphoethanolamine/phosphocholine phosphatase [Amblyraja radiata]